MKTVHVLAGALALGLFVSVTQAQEKPAKLDEGPKKGEVRKPAYDDALTLPGVHQMEIRNGAARTVHYFSDGASPSERAALKEMERAENEMALVDQLQALRRQYVRNERALEDHRAHLQQLLYGYNANVEGSLTTNLGYGGGGYGYPFYGTGWGGMGSGMTAFLSGSANHSLEVGVGDEGRIKTAMAQTLAGQSNLEYTAMARQNLGTAVANLGRPKGNGVAGAVTPPQAEEGMVEKGSKVVLSRLVEGKMEQISGTVLKEDKDWMHLQTDKGKRMVRKSQIEDILIPK